MVDKAYRACPYKPVASCVTNVGRNFSALLRCLRNSYAWLVSLLCVLYALLALWCNNSTSVYLDVKVIEL